MTEDRKQPQAWPLYFTQMQKSPHTGRHESWAIERGTEEAIGRLVKDPYRMQGDPTIWFPDAKMERRLPDVPKALGTKLSEAREMVVDHYIAAGGASPADDPPDPPSADPAPATPAAVGTGTVFDDL